MEPPLKETPNKGNLSIMNRITCRKMSLSYNRANTFITSEERKPLYNEQNNLSQKLRYSEVPLYPLTLCCAAVGYNSYVELIGGAIGVGACAAVRQGNKIYTIADDIPLLHFLSGV